MNTATITTNGTESQAARVIYDLPDPAYRKAAGVSNSMLKALRERWSPEHARARLAKPKETTEALAFGKALHGSLLTPEVAPTWVIAPEGMTRRTKEGKAFYETHRTQGTDVLTAAQSVRLEKTIAAFRAHKLANTVIANGRAEVSVFAPFNLGGTILRKARMDFVTTGTAIVDLKSAADCSPKCIGKRDEFSSQMFDLDYDMQAAFYLDLWNAARPEDPKSVFVFVAMDWDDDLELVGIRVLQCDEATIRSGRDKYTEALAKWIECESGKHWPGYAEDVTMISVPEFAAKKYRTV